MVTSRAAIGLLIQETDARTNPNIASNVWGIKSFCGMDFSKGVRGGGGGPGAPAKP